MPRRPPPPSTPFEGCGAGCPAAGERRGRNADAQPEEEARPRADLVSSPCLDPRFFLPSSSKAGEGWYLAEPTEGHRVGSDVTDFLVAAVADGGRTPATHGIARIDGKYLRAQRLQPGGAGRFAAERVAELQRLVGVECWLAGGSGLPASQELQTTSVVASACAAAVTTQMRCFDERLQEWLVQLDGRLGNLPTASPSATVPSRGGAAVGVAASAQAHSRAFVGAARPPVAAKPPVVPPAAAVEKEEWGAQPPELRPKARGANGGEANNNNGEEDSRGSQLSCVSQDGRLNVHSDSSVNRRQEGSYMAKHREYSNKFSDIAAQGLRYQSESQSIISKLVHHPFFDPVMVTIVLLNCLVLGAQVQHRASTSDPNVLLDVIEYACSGIFTVELLLRVFGFGPRMLLGKAMRNWFLMDFVLVVLPLVEIGYSAVLPDSSSVSVSNWFRLIRVAKILRLVRIMRFCGELATMAMMIISSLHSLFWLLVLLVSLLYIISLIVTDGCTDFLNVNAAEVGSEPYETVRYAYGSLWNTQYTLFKSMAGGVSWGEVSDPLLEVSWIYFMVFIFYIAFVMFSVLNIVTGVFVDSAIQVAQRDRNILVEKEKRTKEATTKHLLTLLEEIDEDNSGEISTEELYDALCKEHILNYFEALQVDTADVRELVLMLDTDGNGVIDIVEFVDGLQKFKGAARSIDLHMMMKQMQLVMLALGIPPKRMPA